MITASVENRTLENILPLVCSVDYTDQRELTVTNAAPGAQYTSVDIVQGEELGNGSLVAEVNGAPVFTLLGGFSLYRDLTLDAQGPDAKLLNDALVALGYQLPRVGADIDTVTEETYRALGVLYTSFGYKPLSKEEAIPASSFIVLNNHATVISKPRSTGDVSSEALALLSSGQKELACKPATGTLSPDAATGQRLRLNTGATVTYPVEVKSEKTTTGANAGSEAQAVPNTQTGTDTGTKYVAVQVPESDLGGLSRFNAELILDSSPQAGLVVPSSALYTTGQGSTLKLQEGTETRDITVRVTFSANGYSMIETDSSTGLTEGSQVVISTGTS
ncbi:MAG TPA: hypothetical protein H9821_04960 [Candidatus Rothia avicola]|uniref:Uncharacterized protein n=1 Tax=Candidatus Rothia avicola TaxID=2840478 RepID=A0A9D1ZSE3_9MICC|nr:hypothetical protein [Candidatus Rothia avicola]